MFVWVRGQRDWWFDETNTWLNLRDYAPIFSLFLVQWVPSFISSSFSSGSLVSLPLSPSLPVTLQNSLSPLDRLSLLTAVCLSVCLCQPACIQPNRWPCDWSWRDKGLPFLFACVCTSVCLFIYLCVSTPCNSYVCVLQWAALSFTRLKKTMGNKKRLTVRKVDVWPAEEERESPNNVMPVSSHHEARHNWKEG